jgi:DNA-binding GntR family transcriptional regulator
MSNLLHETVRQEILRRVGAGEYASGQPLPSAAMLAIEFSVSAITVKRALRDLQTAGTLRSVPGLGTFVRERRRFIRNLDFSFNSLQDARRLGLEPSIRLLSASREKIIDPGLSFFDPPAGLMLCVRKVISVDGAPVMHDTTYVPLPLDDEVVDAFAHKLVMEALRDHGVHFTGTRLLIDAAPASKEAQAIFDIPNGYPTFRRLYRLATQDPGFTVLGIAESPFDRLACTVELEAPDVSVQAPTALEPAPDGTKARYVRKPRRADANPGS